MKRKLPAIWLAFGLVLIGFHFLQGRKIEARETAEFIRQAATQAELNGKHEVALSKFTEALKVAEPEIMRGVSKGVLAKNTASRKISRLSARVRSLKA